MTSRMIRIAVAAVVCSAVGMSYSVSRAQAAAPTRSVWDGVYTKAQAARGATLFSQDCAKCHSADLSGSGETPALVGDAFLADWTGQTAGDLFGRIHNAMPADNPGSVSETQDADIMAFILSSNKFPAGSKELPHDTDTLSQIGVQSTKPGK